MLVLAAIGRGALGLQRRFAEAHAIPVAHTMSGKGGIACSNPLNVGLFGRYSRIANDMIEQADCLIVVGCKLGEIATKRFSLPPVADSITRARRSSTCGATPSTSCATPTPAGSG